MNRLVAAFVLGVCVLGCPSAPAKETQYPPRPPNCEIKLFVEVPPMPTDNIGPVMATCDADISDVDCMRTFKDQACKLGADLIWGVDDVPSKVPGKKKMAGRAAHTKAGAGK